MNTREYRIRNSRKTEDQLDLELEEQFKISNHIEQSRRRPPSATHKKHPQSSQNSRLKESRTGSGFGSSVGSRVGRVLRVSRNEKQKTAVTDIEFNNVRWISIVSAYNAKRLRHVTVSKKSCEAFLKKYGSNLKKDSTALAYFKDIKKHFHSWLGKINESFVSVLNHFLTSNEKSPLIQLQKINPILQQIRYDTSMMKDKLQACLSHYQNTDFRKMSERYEQFFFFSSRLEQIISIIFEKKQKIDSLFFQFENEENVDKDLEKIKKEGIKETKKLIYNDHANLNLCDKIMEKVTHAINDMSAKGLNIYHKLQGAKNLINKIKSILNDTNQKLTMKSIKKFSEIFNQILEEADQFQAFVNELDSENDCVTPELREKIHLCREELQNKKRAVGDMQAIFVGTVINQTIEVLHNSHTLNTVLSQKSISYQEYNHLLDAIADAMLDQTKKTITEGLVKQNRTAFSRLEEELELLSKSLKRHEDGFVIDTEDGQVASMECRKLSKNYKDKIKNLVKKHEDILRRFDFPLRDMKLPSEEKDSELIFFNKLVATSDKINNRERHNKIIHQKAFHELKQGITHSASQLEHTETILKDFMENGMAVRQLNEENPMKKLIKQISTHNGLYFQCAYLLKIFKLMPQTSQKNLIEVIRKVNEISEERKRQLQKRQNYKQTKAYTFVMDRLYCLILVKGLKKNSVKQIDDPTLLTFPENQYDQKQLDTEVNYRSIILQTLGEEASLARANLSNNISALKSLIGGKKLIDKLQKNEGGQYLAETGSLSKFTCQLFNLCILNHKKAGISSQARKIVLELQKFLKSKAMNMDILEGQMDIQNHEAALRVRKEFLHYKSISDSILKICEESSKTQDNDPLQILSNITHAVSQYIHNTKQTAYLALNQWKQPVWIGVSEQSKNGFAEEIDLKGYPRGTFINQYIHQPPKVYDEAKKAKIVKQTPPSHPPPKIEQTKQNPQKTPSNILIKEKSHPKESMDEEILAIQSDRELKQQMVQDIIDVVEDEDMDEEINQYGSMGQQIEDKQMGEQIEDGIQQDKMDQDMADEIGEQEQMKVSIPKFTQQLKKPSQQQQAKYEQKKQEKKVLVYEIVPNFRQLSELCQLFQKINESQGIFWKQNIDFQQIQDYYHRKEDLKDRNNFVKSLQNCLSMFLGTRFGSKLGEIIKNLDKLKTMKGSFLALGEKSWNQLFKVLAITQRNYSVLLNHKAEVKQVFSCEGDSRQFKRNTCKKCVYDFIQKALKTPLFNADKFDYDGFIATCLTTDTEQLVSSDGVSFYYNIRYRAKCDESLPGQSVESDLQHWKNIQKMFENQRKTGINLELLCLQFWLKAIDESSEQYYKPDYKILNNYVKQLSKFQQKECVFHYMTDFRENMLDLKGKIKSHKSSIDNILFKVDNTNVLECFTNIVKLYQNVPVKKILVTNTQGKNVLIYASRDQNSNNLNETSLSLAIVSLFKRLSGNTMQTLVNKQNIIQQVQKMYKEGKVKDQQLTHLMQMLNILEIQHFFMSKPHFLFKNNLQSLVLSALKPLGIKSVQQLNYQQLFEDLFDIKKTTYSTELIIKSKINHKIFQEDYVNRTKQNLSKIEENINKSYDAFKKQMKSQDLSSILPDHLLGKAKNNKTLNLISKYRTELEEFRDQIIKMMEKQQNLLSYITAHEKRIQKASSEIESKLQQIQPLSIKTSKGVESQLHAIDDFFSEIKAWSKTVGLSNQCTIHIVSTSDENYIINIEFQIKKKESTKDYLENIIRKYWMPSDDWSDSWNFVFSKYVEKKIKIQKEAEGSFSIYYKLEDSLLAIINDIRLDIADASNVVDFIKNFNMHKFTHSSQALESSHKLIDQITERLNMKSQLISLSKALKTYQFTGLNNIQIVSSFLGCIRDEIDIQSEQLKNISSLTSSLKGKQITLLQITNWFKLLGCQKLGCHYFQLRSSTGVSVALLPVLKLDKDKTKNHQHIKQLLKDIKIQSDFHLKLEQGIQIVYLADEIVECAIKDSEKYLKNQQQLADFQPDLAEGEMLLLAIQQENEEIPLWISPLKLTAQIKLKISDQRTTANINCGIWRIGIDDYESICQFQTSNKQQQMLAIRKKLRGLASPEEKVKDVRIGQQIIFQTVGEWLKNVVKKHKEQIQQKQRVEQERQKSLDLQRKQQEKFLNEIERDLKKLHIPHVLTSISQLQKKKGSQNTTGGAKISGYYKNIWTTTIKVIEKLEQNKSVEEVGRLEHFITAYLHILENKIIHNYQLEVKIIDKAKHKFTIIQKEREEKKKKKQEQLKSVNIPGTVNPLTVLEHNQEKQQKEVDIVELLVQREQISQKMENFLMAWLQVQQPKDSDFYRCILDEYFSLETTEQQSMILSE